MTPKPWVVFLFLGLGIVAFGFAVFYPLTRPQPTLPTGIDYTPSEYHDAPFFTLTDRSGKEISTADLDGKVWIVSFIFTRCSTVCPFVTRTMMKLQDDLELDKTDDLRFVTITVDPERDKIRDLNDYANARLAHPTKWYFLTGSEKQVRPLLQRGFRVTAQKNPNSTKEGEEFDHSTKIAVVDKFGKIRGLFDGIQGQHDADGKRYQQSYENLKIMVAKLLAEKYERK